MLYVFDNDKTKKQRLNLVWAFTTLTNTKSTRVYLVGNHCVFNLNDFAEADVSGLETMSVEDFVSQCLPTETLKDIYHNEEDFNIEFHSC